MRRKVILAVVVVSLGVLATIACGEAERESTVGEPVVVRIEIERHTYRYVEKERTPIPMVPIGDPFTIEVSWKDDSVSSITFRNLEVVRFDPREEPYWQRDRESLLQLEEEGEPIGERGVTFPYSDEGPTSRTFVLLETGVDRPEAEKKPRLILFELELQTDAGDRVTFDPPWVPRPPTG